MRAHLQITRGPLAGQRARLRPGEPLRVGSSARAGVSIARDEQLAALHFELSWDGAECRLRDLSKRGTLLDGQSVTEAVVHDGGFIVAGVTAFLVRVLPDDLRARLPPPPARWQPPPPALLEARARARAALAAQEGLFAIVDAARDQRIKPLLDASEDESRSLFDGEKGDRLAAVAPYLVRLERGSALLDVLVGEGWGDSWGVYLTGKRPLAEVRRRLRRSLMVTNEETGKKLYFRFYDPRVLRLFWPAATPRQKSEILGTEIDRLLVEDEAGLLLRLEGGGSSP